MGEMVIPHSALPVPTVLYLDDDAANRQAFTAAFRREFRILLAADAAQVWEQLEREHVHVLLADQRLPGIQGSEILRLVKQRFPLVRRMIMTAYTDIGSVIEAINRGGVSQYLQKPWDPEQVVQAVRAAFEEYTGERERTDYTERLLEANRQLEFALRQRLLS
jgi:DNA-binding NtrC family response regulator